MASFLLLHGAWHGAWCWQPVIAELAGAGHAAVAVDLPGLTADTANCAGCFGLADHIEAASAALDRVAGDDVVLVAHSYAGMLARAIEASHLRRLRHVVYIEALYPDPGQCVLDLVMVGGHSLLLNVCDTAHGRVLLPPDVARFAVPDTRMAEAIAARLLPHPFRTFTDPLPRSTPELSPSIERTYVYARDRVPNPYQRFIDRLGAEPSCRLVALTGGHELMLTRPKETANLLRDIAAAPTSRNSDLISN